MGVFDRLSEFTGGRSETASPADDADEPRDAKEGSATRPEEFRDRAEALGERSNVPTLDFTAASAANLDGLVDGTVRPVDDPVTLGSYFGEVLVRVYGGTWVETDDGWAVDVDVGEEHTSVAVFAAARMALASGPVFRDVLDRLEGEGASVTTTDPPQHRSVEATPPAIADEQADELAGDSDADEPTADGRANGEREASDDGSETTEVGTGAGTDQAADVGTEEVETAEAEGAVRDDLSAEDAGEGHPPLSEIDRAAREFATAWPDHDFDFSPESLVRLDAFVDDEWTGEFDIGSLADASTDPIDGVEPLAQVGAYYGQVLGEHLDAEWIPTADGEGAIEVAGRGLAPEVVPVFDVARTCLMDRATFAYRFDALANRIDVDVAARAGPDVFEPGVDTMESTTAIPAVIERAEAFAGDRSESGLDFSPDSLGRVDEIVTVAFADADLSHVQRDEQTDPLALRVAEYVTATGAYYATVLVNHLDANWEIDEDVRVVVEGPDSSMTVDPVVVASGVVRGAISFVTHFERLTASVGIEREQTE